MNWVGGIKRRIVMQEEESRRQQQFFAQRSAVRVNKSSNKTAFKRHDLVPKANDRRREKCNLAPKQSVAEQQEEDLDHRISRQGVVINKNLKLSSVHSSYSEMLIKMEYEGLKKKHREARIQNREKEKLSKKIDSYLKSCSSTSTDVLPSTFKNNAPPIASTSSFRTPSQRSVPQPSSSGRKKPLDRLSGAPKARRILSLTPDHNRRNKIWTPLKKQSVPKVKLASNYLDMIEGGRCMKKTEREKNIIPKVKKIESIEWLNNVDDERLPKRSEEMLPATNRFVRRKIYRDRNDDTLSSFSSDLEDEVLVQNRQSRPLDKEPQKKFTLQPRLIFKGKSSESKDIEEIKADNRYRNGEKCLKLSDFKRSINYGSDAISNKLNRQDKTPYMENLPVPWIGSVQTPLPSEVNTTNSSSTPSDSCNFLPQMDRNGGLRGDEAIVVDSSATISSFQQWSEEEEESDSRPSSSLQQFKIVANRHPAFTSVVQERN